MIRERRRCDKCGGKVDVLKLIRGRKGAAKGTTDERREAWRCADCGAVQLEKIRPTEGVDKS